jgi:multidrug efflux system membrane fusion protein
MHPISVLFTLPQQALPAVARAMRAGAPKVLAYAQGANPTPAGMLDSGVLAVLDNQVDPTTGTIKLKATFANPDNRLWPGGFVGVRLLVDVAKQATMVPPAAVQRGPRGNYVYVVTDTDEVSRRQVTVGHEDETASVITEGVKPGDRVVVDGAARLTDGAHVTIAQPAGTQPGSSNSVAATSAPGAARTTERRSGD